ncbi:MAG TPA: nucleotide exchange factor GrpE [Bryobacteraceae bacterium]|nr:nucleotide exchange factor GrpE [Bryobacteraceae bacterium]
MEPRADDTALAVDPAEHIAALTAERDQLVQEKADLQDRLLRRQAEFENFRRRSERERLDVADFVSMETVRPLLTALDDFERALKAAQTTDGADTEFVKGVELIYNRLLDTLTKLGLEPIEAVGRPFDPNQHNAIQREETQDAEENTVLEEYQRGYNFRGRLLRPSMVKVAVRS